MKNQLNGPIACCPGYRWLQPLLALAFRLWLAKIFLPQA